MKTKDLRSKLKAYSAVAASLIGIDQTAHADIVFHDVDPDSTYPIGGMMNASIDLDGDGTNDFFIRLNTFFNTTSSTSTITNTLSAVPYNNNQIMGMANLASALDKGTYIDAVQAFRPAGTSARMLYIQSITTSSSSGPFTNQEGNWQNATDKYLGLRIDIGGGNYHYGWVRLDVNNNASAYTVKSWAYESDINQPIIAGFIQTDSVSNVQVAEVGNNSDASDIQVAFTEPADISIIDEYRVMVVKSSKIGTFNLDSADAIGPSGYTVVSKVAPSNVYSGTLPASANDVDGNPIQLGVDYNVFVLSIADGVQTNVNRLSSVSDTIQLSTPSDPVTALSAADVDENGNGSDVQITFTEPLDTAGIAEYRVIAVKSPDATSFNIDSANQLTTEFTSIVPVAPSSMVQQTLDFNMKDVDGDSIIIGQPYKFFVLTVANGMKANINALSAESNELTLTTATDSVANIQVLDVADSANGRDLEVRFTEPADTSVIDEYRIMVVKSTSASTFDLAQANAVIPTNYTSEAKVAPSQIHVDTLASNATDVDGDLLTIGVPYNVFVLSVADGMFANVNNLSAMSDTITLNTEVDTVSALAANDIANNKDASDIEVSFVEPTDTSGIAEYRVLVVKNSFASSFDLASANAVGAGNYDVIVPVMPSNNVTQSLSAVTKDVDGDDIELGQAYNLFVLSVANGVTANVNSLSDSSSQIILINPTDSVTAIGVADIANNGNGSDLEVAFTEVSDTALIDEYRIIVVKSSKATAFDLDSANNVVLANYTSVTPQSNGGNLNISLSAGATDSDGDNIVNGVSYKAFVLSVGKAFVTNGNNLSAESSEITLKTVVEAVTGISATDVSNNGNGTDMEVAFTEVSDTSLLDEYRVMVVKSANASSFNLDSANNVSVGNYTSIAPQANSSLITQALDANAKDTDGDAIANSISYRVFVLSVGDAMVTDSNNLSNASSQITLKTAVEATTGVSISDVSDNGNGSDLEVTFTEVNDTLLLEEYRVIIVKSSQSGTFNLAIAEALPMGNYTVVEKENEATQKILTLDANAKDSDGDDIAENVPYKAFILSVGDTALSDENALSAPSSELTLMGDVSIAEGWENKVELFSAGDRIVVNLLDENTLGTSISVYNLVGQKIYNSRITEDRSEVELRDVKGIVIVAIEDKGKQIYTQKVLLK